ncbi:tRNA-dihydrouridine synthase [Patescibacteria group bacterium]|nr:tRNA-dihydrouridine synthase [Patescibacteria group bacterium]
MLKGFWNTLPVPIIGLSPMDGVTDAAFRYLTARHGKPDVIFTEFVSVEGIAAGAVRLLEELRFDPIERPIVAQLFGADPSAFFKAAVVVSCLGFDGIDINMGCPSKSVTGHGGGAALILDPDRAREIVRQTRAGTEAWANGLTPSQTGLPDQIIAVLPKLIEPRQPLPVSVKTRIGYDRPVIDRWIPTLLETEPAVISLHGRTLKQLYTGEADWEAIGTAAAMIRSTETKLLGNGDVRTVTEARERCRQYETAGALIGRAAQGNPWVFQDYIPTWTERLKVALEHARYFARFFPEPAFVRMRKHLLDYIKGVEGAKEIRNSLMRVTCLSEVEAILAELISTAETTSVIH